MLEIIINLFASYINSIFQPALLAAVAVVTEAVAAAVTEAEEAVGNPAAVEEEVGSLAEVVALEVVEVDTEAAAAVAPVAL